MKSFEYGARVRIKGGDDGPDETGSVVSYEGDGMYEVEVDDPASDEGGNDDGVRLVPVDALEALP